MTWTLRELVKALHAEFLVGVAGTRCTGVSIDSRSVRDGNVFFALTGPRFDGHNFLKIAVDRGARAVVVHRRELLPVWSPARAPAVLVVADTLRALQDLARFERTRTPATVIGITGSNGKTTTKEMLAAIVKRAGPTLATHGNFNNQVGVPLTLCRLAPEHRFAVIELGTSHPGDMSLLADVTRPTIAMITNVGQDHLEFLLTPEGVLAENRLLFDRLPPDGVALINLDDPLLKALASELTCRTLTYGFDPTASVRAQDVVVSASTVQFTLVINGDASRVVLPTPSALQVRNAMAAAAGAYASGVSTSDIRAGLADFRPSAMRLQIYARADGILLVNDAYNANPSSMRASVESFCQSYPSRRRWLVLGDMRELGPRGRHEHGELGTWLAAQTLDRLYLYGRDTRFVAATYAAAHGNAIVERFRKKRQLLEALQRAFKQEKPAVLFKASRSLQLEHVIEPLKDVLSPIGTP